MNNNYDDDYLFRDIEAEESDTEETTEPEMAEAETEKIEIAEASMEESAENNSYRDEDYSRENVWAEETAYESANEDSDDEDKTNLGLISFLLFIGSFVISGSGNLLNKLNIDLPLYGFIDKLQGLMMFASFVIMIITRVKYPENRFGKAVMWLFIVLAILFAVAIIALVVLCTSCAGELKGM